MIQEDSLAVRKIVLATIYAIKGLLLEEVLLQLLRASGYYAVENANGDSSLNSRNSGSLEVRGRGSKHQIDAIADFSVSPPFSYPIRLLLEAKFYKNNVGIEIVRNAVGVLKDVSEFWIVDDSSFKPRYHYQYAIFTSSSFTKSAQEYAFAQDVYLIKLENNRYFYPVIRAIEELNHADFRGVSEDNIDIDLTQLRRATRSSLGNYRLYEMREYCTDYNFNSVKICNVIESSLKIGTSYLGVLGNSFPIFFTPSDNFDINDLINDPTIRICWDQEKWYVVKRHARCVTLDERDIILSFDLPDELFKLYSDNNMLTKSRALDLKQDFMSSIKIMFRDPNRRFMSSLELRLDNNWLEEMRQSLS